MSKHVQKWLSRLRYVGEASPYSAGLIIERDMDGRTHADEGFAYRSATRCIQYREGKRTITLAELED